MKKNILLATVAFALWGCSQEQDDLGTGPVTYDPTKVITVVTDLTETRGTPITNSANLMDFGLYCAYTGTSNWTSAASLAKMNNTKLLRTAAGGAWQYDGAPVYWDAATASDKYTFFAYAPYATASNGITINAAAAGTPTLTYNVPVTTADQPDLMVAVPQKDIIAGNTVTLEMKHALACIGFQIAGNGEKVTAISISGVIMSGTLAMDPTSGSPYTVNWSSLGTAQATDLSPIINSTPHTTTPTMTTNLLAGNGYLMMIPQTLTAGAKLKVTYEGGTSIEFDLSGEVWKAGDKRTYNITTEVLVTPEVLVIPHTGTDGTWNNIAVTTSKSGIKWTLQTAASWLKLGLLADGSDKGSSVNGTGTQTVYTFADLNATAANLTTTVTLNGATTEVVKVTQLHSGGGLDVLANFFTGAFWRAGETGERILRNNDNITPWAISVLWMDDNWAADDILLAAGLNSAYTDFPAVNSSPGNAESYPVPAADAKTSLSGTGKIEFRVGLKTTWDNHATTGSSKYNSSVPARYAVLVLSYGTSYGSQQKIFLRQGHEADYVMRNGDAAGSESGEGWNGTRTVCVKISPYNLTAPLYKTNPAFTGTDITEHATIPERASILAANVPDYFTDYPSQAGAFFQWAGATAAVERKAYHPTKHSEATVMTGWNALAAVGFWTAATNPLSANNETCPPGWRRPNDGVTNANVPAIASGFTDTNNNIHNSEMRQSLWLNPQNSANPDSKNSIWGYYADGYFDRRAIETSIGLTLTPNSAVAPSSSIPAYRGRLFFNPVTNASLFFPATGLRDYSGGQLNFTGLNAAYWSSSAGSSISSWVLSVLPTTAGQGISTTSYAYSIRCVDDPEAIIPGVTVDPYNPNPTNLKD